MVKPENDTLLNTLSQQGLKEVIQFFQANQYVYLGSLPSHKLDFVLHTSTEYFFPRLHCFLPLDQSDAPIFGQMGIHLDEKLHKGNYFTGSGQELVSQEIMRLKDLLQDPASVPLSYSQLLINRLNHLALFGASEIITKFRYRSGKLERRDRKHQGYNREKRGWVRSLEDLINL